MLIICRLNDIRIYDEFLNWPGTRASQYYHIYTVVVWDDGLLSNCKSVWKFPLKNILSYSSAKYILDMKIYW